MRRRDLLNYRRETTQTFLYEITFFLELIVAAMVIIIIIGMIIGMAIELIQSPSLLTDASRFTHLLGTIMNIVVGIEFLKMLCRHNLDSVIEVLLFALARQLIATQHTVLESLLCVVSVTILFLVRKYLFVPKLDTVAKN